MANIFGAEQASNTRSVVTPKGTVKAIPSPTARETYVPLAAAAPGVAYQSGSTGTVQVIRARNSRQSFV